MFSSGKASRDESSRVSRVVVLTMQPTKSTAINVLNAIMNTVVVVSHSAKEKSTYGRIKPGCEVT